MNPHDQITTRLNELCGVTKPEVSNKFKPWRNLTHEEKIQHCKERIDLGYSLSSTEYEYAKENGLLTTKQ